MIEFEEFDEWGFCHGCGREIDCTEWNGDCEKCEPQEEFDEDTW